MTDKSRPEIGDDIRQHLPSGPDRVLIDAEGTATTCRRAREEHGISPDVIFIRNDGWALGAPSHLEAVARSMWQDEWAGLIRRPSFTIEAIPS